MLALQQDDDDCASLRVGVVCVADAVVAGIVVDVLSLDVVVVLPGLQTVLVWFGLVWLG